MTPEELEQAGAYLASRGFILTYKQVGEAVKAYLEAEEAKKEEVKK